MNPFKKPPPPTAKPPTQRLPKRPDPPEMFAQLLPCTWRGIHFPVSSLKGAFEQALAMHKYWGVDAASIEATGREPIQIEAEIPFINGIVAGRTEKWPTGRLYPYILRQFLAAMADRTDGLFGHPELGEIVCKPRSVDFTLEGQQRDGMIVRASWIETLPEGLTPKPASAPIDDPSRVVTLDADTKDIRGLATKYQPPVFEETFESAMNKITGNIDKITTSANLIAGRKAAMMYRIGRLEDSIRRARTPMTWATQDAVDRVKDFLLKPEKPKRATARYTTPVSTTLATLALQLGVQTSDLIALNPPLLAKPEVPAGATVRFYVK